MNYVISVDIGGTHTDCVTSSEHEIKVSKVPTTVDLTSGVLDAVEMVAKEYGINTEDILSNCDRFIYGSTIATNMLVTKTLPKIGLLCTKGHRDSLLFRDGWKPDRWNLKSRPLWEPVPRYLRRPAEERINYSGNILTELNEDGVRREAQYFKKEGVKAVAICFLWSHINPAHEQRAKEILQEELPDIPIVISYDVLPTIREWERTFCTCLSAGILVAIEKHLIEFREKLSRFGYRGQTLIMQGNGGHATIDDILGNPLSFVESGPSSGALAGVFYGDLTKSNDVMTIDMGGTSFDVCVLPGNKIPITKSKRLLHEPIGIPSVLVHTIGAGGGSIAWIDDGGVLNVGPKSAGSNPGPACYGQGGTEPTVTDTYLMLGYEDADCFLGGRREIHPQLAEEALRTKIAEPLGIDLMSAAYSIIEIQNSQMADAMKLLSVQRGIDPRPFTVVVGGGAGPLQATLLARSLGIRRVVVPRRPGAFSALGQITANIVHNEVRTFATRAEETDWKKLSNLYKNLEKKLADKLIEAGITTDKIIFKRFIDVRYVGQVYEIEASVPKVDRLGPEHFSEIVNGFEEGHQALYHFKMENYPTEFLSCRVEASGAVPKLSLQENFSENTNLSAALKGKRQLYDGSHKKFVEVPIYDGEKLNYGDTIDGIAIVETYGSTAGVWENDRLKVNEYGDFEIEILDK